MKRKYISPETELLKKYTCTICAGSLRWIVDPSQEKDEDSPDVGGIFFDQGEGHYSDKDDPWNSANW